MSSNDFTSWADTLASFQSSDPSLLDSPLPTTQTDGLMPSPAASDSNLSSYQPHEAAAPRSDLIPIFTRQAALPFHMDSHPSEQSLIQCHLRPWVASSCRHKGDGSVFIYEADPYTDRPDVLARVLGPAVARDGKEAWFLLAKLRPVSQRVDQARVKRDIAGGGWWQSEKKEKAVVERGAGGQQQVGWKKNFTFMEKVRGRKVRPGWIMSELRLHPEVKVKVELEQGVPEIKIPVLCKVYPSPRKRSDLGGSESDGSACSTPTSDGSACSTPTPSDGNMSGALNLALVDGLNFEDLPNIPSDQHQPNGLFEANARDPDFFSIPRCVSVLNTMQVTNEEKAKAYAVFKTLENRQIFLSASSEAPEAAMIWLRSEIGNQL